MTTPTNNNPTINRYAQYLEKLQGEIKPIDKKVMECIPESPPKNLNLESTPDLSWRTVTVRQNAHKPNEKEPK